MRDVYDIQYHTPSPRATFYVYHPKLVPYSVVAATSWQTQMALRINWHSRGR